VFPAIDVRAGRAVRLHQGDFAAETVYDDDPVGVARAFALAGAEWIHVVDLDAARTGEPANLAVVEAIASAVPSRVQAGGGVRSVEAASALLLAGAARVVIGTAAVENPGLVDELCSLHGGSVVVGLDARDGEVAVRGWTEGSGRDLLELARQFEASGVEALVVTEVARDGTMEGPSLDQLRSVLEATELPVIASGGVGSLGDLDALVDLQAADRGLAGAIVGRALYEGRFSLGEALAQALRPGTSPGPGGSS
jgi:phosphoribosylformimino-5-aminoimidazole carboxamide ribotide isomerase